MKHVTAVCLIIGLAVIVFASSKGEVSLTVAASKNENDVLTIAHLGASGYAPENTMAAFDKAVKMKADMIELDVQMSKDGELVVIHDTTVDRTTDGTGKVKNFTFEELKALDAGSSFNKKFAGEKIPALGEVLDEYKGRIGILIELKSPSLYPGIEQRVAHVLKERDMDKLKNKTIIVQSFEHESVKNFHSILPEVSTGLLLEFSPDGISEQELTEFSAYAEYVNPNKTMVSKRLVERIHEFGMKTYPWTVREADSVKPLVKAGVDGIITDYPDYVEDY